LLQREHDADDVLADVVDVALDGGEQDRPCAAGRRARRLLLLHERLEVGDGLLHHARALDHLRQEHLAGAEQVADDVHAVHQRALDDVERARSFWRRLLGVGLDEVDDAPCTSACSRRSSTGPRATRSSARFLPAPLTVSACRQPLGRVGAAVEEHVLDALEQLGLGMSS
jgi:hypothetical protein